MNGQLAGWGAEWWTLGGRRRRMARGPQGAALQALGTAGPGLAGLGPQASRSGRPRGDRQEEGKGGPGPCPDPGPAPDPRSCATAAWEAALEPRVLGSWVAQPVERLRLDLSLGLDLRVLTSSPELGAARGVRSTKRMVFLASSGANGKI